jgi:hypothetical protein
VGYRLFRALTPLLLPLLRPLGRLLYTVLEGWRLVLLWVCDRVWLGKPARVLGWIVVDTYRTLRTGLRPRLYGLWLVVGLYGAGKTAFVVHELEMIRAERGRGVRIFTNFGWAGEDGPIEGWRHLLAALEYDTPSVFAWDELGSSFDQHQYGKEFPRDLFRFVTQMRKGPGVRVYCTVQRFSNASVDLRRLAQFIIEVRSYFRARWVFAKAFEGYEEYNDGIPRYVGFSKQDYRNIAWRRSFVFSDWLRGRYDSFRIIPALKEMPDETMAALGQQADSEARRNYQTHAALRGISTAAPAAIAPAGVRGSQVA